MDRGPEMPGAFRSGPDQMSGDTARVNEDTDAAPPLPLPSIWAQAINGLSILTNAVTDEGATMADALGQIFQADEEAIADMANLKPCSAAALQQLKDAGLKTTLKNHQSSGLKFLVDSEHRQLPGPREGDVCLWGARRGARGNLFYVNRVSHDVDKSPKLPRGAILSDAMGLGKTLTILALILAPDDGKGIIDAPDVGKGKASTSGSNAKSSAKEEVKAKPRKKRLVMPTMGTPLDLDSDIEWSSSSGDESEDKEASQKKLPTLIVCPLSVVSNWVGQVKTHLDAKKFRIGVLHGPEGVKLQKEKNWSKYNVIVTTYDVLASCYRHLALLKGHVKREVEFEDQENALRKSLDSYEKFVLQERGLPALAAAKEVSVFRARLNY
jgi:SNF2 family DNA or RNA helicase